MKITIIYDNEAWEEGLEADWGFACLVEAHGRRLLFDTGASGSILLKNMRTLGITPASIDEVFISHAHRDHTGGLSDFLELQPVRTYVPPSFKERIAGAEFIELNKASDLHEGIFSTGELESTEQSLAVKTEKGLAVIVGCSHPGVGSILRAASQFGKPHALIGGLHGFEDFPLIEDLELVCPTHCTQFRSEIESLYPAKCIIGGAGRVIEI